MTNQSDSNLEMIYGSIFKGIPQQHQKMLGKQVTKLLGSQQNYLEEYHKNYYQQLQSFITELIQEILAKPISCNNNNDTIAKLWVQECTRVFCDRLISVQDKLWFYNTAVELIKRQFNINKDDITNNKLFNDILKLEAANFLYEEVTEKRKVIVKSLQDKLDDYILMTNDKIELVYFDDALKHILRISQIYRQPKRNAILIGVSGSEKQSLTKIASFLMRSEIFLIEIVKTYNADSFRADLMKILMKNRW